MNNQEVTEAYDRLVARALLIVDSAPSWAFVHEEDHAKIKIEGEIVTPVVATRSE